MLNKREDKRVGKGKRKGFMEKCYAWGGEDIARGSVSKKDRTEERRE